MSRSPRTAVIGAGSSGIAAAEGLRERGVTFTAFETSDGVGGTRVLGNRDGMSAAYRGLHVNTSRDRTEFSDNRIELFSRVLHPGVDNGFLVALVPPFGATRPIAERHGQWIADLLRGAIDFDDREPDLERERAAGARRARAAGFVPPVAARAE